MKQQWSGGVHQLYYKLAKGSLNELGSQGYHWTGPFKDQKHLDWSIHHSTERAEWNGNQGWMTFHRLIRKLQVDEQVLPESLTAEMLVGWHWGPGRVKMVQKLKSEGKLPRRREHTQQGDRRPGKKEVRRCGDRNMSFRTTWTRSPVPVMPSKAMCSREPYLPPP